MRYRPPVSILERRYRLSASLFPRGEVLVAAFDSAHDRTRDCRAVLSTAPDGTVFVDVAYFRSHDHRRCLPRLQVTVDDWWRFIGLVDACTHALVVARRVVLPERLAHRDFPHRFCRRFARGVAGRGRRRRRVRRRDSETHCPAAARSRGRAHVR